MIKNGIIKRFSHAAVLLGMFLVLGLSVVHAGCPAGSTCTDEGCVPKIVIQAAVNCSTFNYAAAADWSYLCNSYYCDALSNGCYDKNRTANCFTDGSFCYYCNQGYSPLIMSNCALQYNNCTNLCGNVFDACFASCPGYGPTEVACEDKCRVALTNCQCGCYGFRIDCENKSITSLNQQRVQCLQQQSTQPQQQVTQPQALGIWEWLIRILNDIWNAIARLFGFGGANAQCPLNLTSCGGGCMPKNAVCRDNGVINSYCLQPTSGYGSENCYNCSEGQVHCGMKCIPAGQVCCLGSICPNGS